MTYTTKAFGVWTEFSLKGDSIVITERRNWRKHSIYEIPRDALSTTSGLVEQPDRALAWVIRCISFVVVLGLVFFFLRLELTGFPLWLGIVVLGSAIVFAPSITPKTKYYVAYSSGGQAMFSFSEKRRGKGKEEFEIFVTAYKQWLNEKPAEPAGSGNSASLRP